MSPQDTAVPRVLEPFRKACGDASPPSAPKPAAPTPFSLRLTTEERARLDREAGDRPLGAYIRERLLGEQARPRRRCRKPSVDAQQITLVLAALGRSRLASNLNQLARAANTGTLDVSEEVEQDLRDACSTVFVMREVLLQALGMKPEAELAAQIHAGEEQQ